MAVGALRSLNAKSSELLNASGKVWSKCDRNVPSSNAAKGAFAVLPSAKYMGSRSTMLLDTLTGVRYALALALEARSTVDVTSGWVSTKSSEDTKSK